MWRKRSASRGTVRGATIGNGARPDVMVKAAIILILLFGLATAWGAQSVYLGIRDREPVEISCADYIAHPPAGRWIKLVDCDPDFTRTLERLDDGELDAVWVPLRPRGVTTGPARLVVETDGEQLPATTRSVQGMMRVGLLDAPSDDFRATLARDVNATRDAAILSLGDEPHLGLGLLALLGGLAGLAVAAHLSWGAVRGR